MKSKRHIQAQLEQTRIAIGIVLLLLVLSIVLFVRSKPVEAPISQSESKPASPKWKCPVTAWIRCPFEKASNDPSCKEGFTPWARTNCPGFEGVIYFVSK